MSKLPHTDARPLRPSPGATTSYSTLIISGLFLFVFLLVDTTGATPFSAPNSSSSPPSPTTSAITSLGQTTSLARPNQPIQAPLARRTPQIDNGAASGSSSSSSPTSTGTSSSTTATRTRSSTSSNSCLLKTCYPRSSLTTCITNINFACFTSTTSSYRYSYSNYGSNYGSSSSSSSGSSSDSSSSSNSTTVVLAVIIPFIAIFVLIGIARCATRDSNTTSRPSNPPAASTTANTGNNATATVEMSAISRANAAREPVHREEEEAEEGDRAEMGDRPPPYGEQRNDGGLVVPELAAVSAPVELHTRGTDSVVPEAGHREAGGTAGGGGQSQWVDPAPAYVGR